ncbi:hypothetical protein CWC31_04760 [Pseudoalteromonas ruthenica]|uniref:MMPL family transporter n=1 Tax=Pseudoalteromonas ruthenica TaxID=151081 RepID=UPI001107BA6F|nr:hypothetical protein [Pseudoalteromonas ruthenica]TLX51897.1 hypothetical protein CWC31_04760 [Pseudoalteromonas ruthenica]
MSSWARSVGIVLWPTFLLLCTVAVWTLKEVRISADMMALLERQPTQALDAQFYSAQQQLSSTAQNQLVFSFSGKTAVNAYHELAQQLQQHPSLKVKVQPTLKRIAEFYQPYRGALMSEGYQQALRSPTAFSHYAQRQLSQTASPWLSSSISDDPSLATFSFLDTFATGQQLSLVDGKLQWRQGDKPPVWLLVSEVTTTATIWQNNTLAAELVSLVRTLRQGHPETEIEYSGVLFHNSENAEQAQWEMNRFGLASLVLLAVFVMLAIRGVWPLWVSLLTVSSAVLAGALALLLLRQQLHVLSLVFATTLIGVAIDYALHALSDRAKKSNSYSVALKRGLLLALGSTALGYACFFTAPMSLLQDVAIFIVAGLCGAWFFVRFVVIRAQRPTQLRPLALSTADCALTLFARLRRRKGAIALTLAGVSGLLLSVQWPQVNDSIASFNASSAQLMQAQKRHHLYLNGDGPTFQVLVRGESIEQLLINEERVRSFVQLHQGRFQGLSVALPSQQSQQQALTLYRQAQQQGRFSFLTQLRGAALPADANTLLSYEQFAQGPLADVFLAPIKQGPYFYSLSTVSALEHASLSGYLAEFEDMLLVDVPGQLSVMLAHFHHSIHWALALAVLAIAIVFIAFFGLRRGAAMVAWLTLSALLVVTLIAVVMPLSVFHTLGLILVLALAVDYFIFYQQSGRQPTTFVAISLSALSSLAVFAMLVFSNTPAISQFGAAVLIGLIVVYWVAPLSIENKNDKSD